MFNIVINRSTNLVKLGIFLVQTFHRHTLNGSKHIRIPNYCRLFCSELTSQGPNIELITNGDTDLEHKLKVLILEVDVMRQEGKLVPEERHMKDEHWQELLKLPTISSRRRYLEFLFKISKKRENQEIKKEQRKLELLKTKPPKKPKEEETFEDYVSTYDLAHNNIFLRFYDTTINQMYNNRLIQAMQFGQKLVVDCGYHHQMTTRENKNCAKQLMFSFSENRTHDDPFDLHLCNVNRNSLIMTEFSKFIPTMYEPWFPLNIHETSYMDVFNKEQLVYLTPHCREELLNYDHDAVYIIGGIVDVMNNQPLSLAKAKKEGIRMAKFPLDRYLQWGAGSGKSLTLNQVASILLDMKVTGDWKYALRHVPRRKIVEIDNEKQIKKEWVNEKQNKREWRPSNKFNPFKPQKKDKDQLTNRIKVRSIMYD